MKHWLIAVVAVAVVSACGTDPAGGMDVWDGGFEETEVDVAGEDRRGRAELPDTGAGDSDEAGAEVGEPDSAGECNVDTDCEGVRGQPAACAAWACQAGSCVPADVPDKTPCDDDNQCTDADQCMAGQCEGEEIDCDDDGNPCTQAACEPETGCGQVPLTGIECDDGDDCNVEDLCLAGECQGQPMFCDDGNDCTLDECLVPDGCANEPLTGPGCNDGDACTGPDICQQGECLGTEIVCDDGNQCTQDGCDPDTGCTAAPLNGHPCDDGSICTTSDHCQAGQCTGTAVSCNDGNPCTDDICDPLDGCQYPEADGTPCNDGNACTDQDQCVAGICMGQASKCDDGNPCTLDSCNAQGGCIHTEPPGLPCDDANACTVADKCYQGACVPGFGADCDDGNECTVDSCLPETGCAYENLIATECDDGSACTFDDQCLAGICQGLLVDCNDDNVCTGDSCDPAVGCVNSPVAGDCDDDDPCTEGDYCADGQCQPGPNPECLAMERVVLAGDSWSTGMIQPLRDAFDDRGYEEVVISWEVTSKPGSKVAGWLADANLMATLFVALDSEPKAGMLVFTLTGNDFLAACKSGLGVVGPVEWFLIMAKIQIDLQVFVSLVKAGRPDLKVLIVGYDYLHFEMIQLLGNTMPGFNTIKFNLGLIDLAGRERDVAAAFDNTVYAHNMGLLQHTFGDYFHPPFLCPNPVVGCPEYGAGAAPKPGPAPGYDPFPGGWYTYPSPIDYIPDGVHPNYDGFRAIVENSLDQGAADWIEGVP